MVTMTEEDDEPMSDNDIPENVHNRLLGAISHLYKQKRVKAPLRKEYSLKVSEFHLTKPVDKKKGKIEITELAKVLNKRAGHVKINEQIKSAKSKSRKLPKPLEKPHAEKIQRTVGYENVKQDLSQWDAVVYHQRVAEHVSFPLKESKMQIHKDPNDFLTTFKTPTELELKLAETLNSSELYRKEKEEEQEQEDFPLSLEEIKERRSIMARLRAQLSYKEAKAARQNRIKSKKFHRIQRKEKIKTQIKEFEELQKSDPEAALKKLEQLEKARAQERASLRHRTTGQWARNLAVRAKYNKEARIALSEQLSQSRELTQKLRPVSSDEEKENSSDDESKGIDKNDIDNSWLNKEPVSEVQEFYDKYKKYEGDETRKKETNKSEFVTHNVIIKSPQNIGNTDDECGNIDETFEINAGSLDVVKKNTNVNSRRRNSNKKINKELGNHEPTIKSVSNSPLGSKNKKTEKCVLEDKPKNYIKDSVVEVKFSVLKRSPQTSSSSAAVEYSAKKGHITQKKQMKRKLPTKSGTWSITPLKQKSNLKTAEDNKKECIKICNEHSSKNDVKLTKSRNNSKLNLDDMFYEAEERLNEIVTKKVKKLKQSLEAKDSESKIEAVHLDDDSEYNNNNNSGLEMKKQNLQTEIDEKLGETSKSFQIEKENIISEAVERYSSLSKNLDPEKYKKSLNIEPNNFLHAKPKRLNTEVPNSFASAEDNLDDAEDEFKMEEKSMTISEAFACDDVEEEFKQDKEEEIKKSQIEDVNLVLPGWGSWGGPNVNNIPKHKSKKFILKFPKEIPRKDENKGNVVINEDRDEKLKPYLVTELPFPFTSVKEYEASIRAPVGNTWMPQSAHRKLIAPGVTTKLGTIIEPMTKDQILKDKENLK